jgi:hypothetical protein
MVDLYDLWECCRSESESWGWVDSCWGVMEKGGGGKKSVTLEGTLITTTISAALGGYSTAQGSLMFFF